MDRLVWGVQWLSPQNPSHTAHKVALAWHVVWCDVVSTPGGTTGNRRYIEPDLNTPYNGHGQTDTQLDVAVLHVARVTLMSKVLTPMLLVVSLEQTFPKNTLLLLLLVMIGFL
jgi:hypothetical protein